MGIQKGSIAVGHLNEALRLEPVKLADAHLSLGALYDAAGMKEKAAREYEIYLSKRPDYPKKDTMRAYIIRHKG